MKIYEPILQTINDMIKPEVQQIITFYSKHVKYLCLRNFQEAIRGHAIHRLSTSENPLFPNLQYVYIPSLENSQSRNTAKMDVVFLAFSSSVTTLSISNINTFAEDDVASYLSVLHQKQARLQDITLGGCLTNHSLSLIHRFSTLKFLNLSWRASNLSSSVFALWANLPSLVGLVLALDVSSTFDTPDNQSQPTVSLPALHTLLVCGRPAEVLKVLQSISESRVLTDIKLGMFSDHSAVEPVSVYSAILIACIAESIRINESLEVFGIQMADRLERNITLPEDSILRLSKCERLEWLVIKGVIAVAIDDITIRMVCDRACWKNLRVLSLPHAVVNKSPSLVSLKAIARNCPSLEELGICVDFQLHNYDSLNREREGPRLRHHLKKLSLIKFSNSGVRNAVDIHTVEMAVGVSRFIEYYFPDLKATNLTAKSSADMHWWEGVLALMSEYQTIRVEMLAEQEN